MSSAGDAAPINEARQRILGLWVAPVALVVCVWLWLAFSSGGYIARHWLVPSLTLGLFGLVVSLLVAYPRQPRQLSLALLALFSCYAVWVAASGLWADSTARVWIESGRTLSYLLVLSLALVYFTDAAARRAFRYLLMTAALVVLVLCIWKLWSTDNITRLFISKRFYYPVSYPNNAAALFLVALWPLMWLAAGPEERSLVRGASLGLVTGLLGLAIMTQSRGAVWSLAFSAVFIFVVSPARMRTLVYLLVPALLMVYEFPSLNRYWLEGPEAVGGGLAARTLVVASVTAGLIGTLLALLERWVRVTGRPKIIAHTVITLAVITVVIYGSMALTSDVGGPVKWVSQAWRQFFAEAQGPAEGSSASRLMIVSDSGRVEIWTVAWQAFKSTPVLGVGADNFVFRHDRFRVSAHRQAQQAHSFELQVLGETGLVGGIFAFGGILLAATGLLWPRCTAGWRGAKKTWLQQRRSLGASHQRRFSLRWCNPRWGDDSRAYAWEMALTAGAFYWLVHASVDWLWQMPGVTIPAVLFVAAGVAAVDARAGVFWPRLRRWLEIRPPSTGVDPVASQAARPALLPDSPDQSGGPDRSMSLSRRPTRHATKHTRLGFRLSQRRQSEALLQTPGFLPHVFRALLMLLSLVVLIVAGLPYLSLQIQDSARALAQEDPMAAIGRAGAAASLLPNDPDPLLTQASIYSRAASTAAASSAADRSGAVMDNLALALDRLEGAVLREPAGWTIRYRAGVTALNLLLAAQCVAGCDPELDYAALIAEVPGLEDWSVLRGADDPPPAPGIASGSLVVTSHTHEKASYYRSLSRDDLADLALEFLRGAAARNPLTNEVSSAMDVLQQVRKD